MNSTKRSFSIEVLEILKRSGWNEFRRVNHDEIINKLVSEGYMISNIVVDFLAQFESLNITFFNKKRNKEDDFNFSLEKAFHLEVPERLNEDYRLRIGNINLCPIGTAYRDQFVLMMDSNGKVYGGYDDFLIKLGDCYQEAINSIVEGVEFTEIPQKEG